MAATMYSAVSRVLAGAAGRQRPLELVSGPNARSSSERRSLSRAGELFCKLLDRSLRDASIAFTVGRSRFVAGERTLEPSVTVAVAEPRMFEECLARGSLGLAESYMDHDFELTQGTLAELLQILLRNQVHNALRHDYSFLADVLRVRLQNNLRGSAGNVQFHYDLGTDLFESFLDSTMTYSCGYAVHEDDSLEQLQQNKLDRICRKLRLKPGDRLLDIGCGFAGLLIFAAKNYGVHGVGITLSNDQHQLGKRRVAEAGLGDKISIQIRDHAQPWSHEFDRVVSVGMLEHLPRSEYTPYFRNIAAALKPSGLALVHAIGCQTVRNKHDPFIQKYIFPRSAQPRLSEMASQIERNSMKILDVENMVRHYALTCKGWLENFQANYHKLPQDKYDDRFKRMWEFYLSGGIATARASEQASLYQVLFTNDAAMEHPYARV